MNSRERYLRAIHFAGPDRVPILHRTLAGAFHHHGKALADLYRRYPSDGVVVSFGRAIDDRKGVYDGLVDEWGCTWSSLTDDYLGQVVGHPLDCWERLESYRFPDPLRGLAELDAALQRVKEEGHQRCVLASIGRLWHRITFLRGFANALLDVADDREELYWLRDKVAGMLLRRIEKLAEYRDLIDVVLINDDWGSQQTLMIRPESWRKIFRPAYQQLVDAIHSAGFLASLHTDGHTREILPDLIEIGFDELNPQVFCMDVEELGEKFGGKVCFRADLDRQHVLPFGKPADVAAHVRRAFAGFGRSGGGFVGYGQIGTDVPLANAEAMLSTLADLVY